MMSALASILAAVRQRQMAFWLTVILLTVGYYCLLMVSLIISFDNLPNYGRFYNWPANVAEILSATPSLTDALQIISEEWLIEIGFMNYDYGFGISEWSLNIMPFKVMLVVLLAMMMVINWRLYQHARTMPACSLKSRKRWMASAGTGFGALLVGAANMTMFWVVCCASPSWVVGLAMLGLVSVSGALALEDYETLVMVSGFALLLVSMFILGRQIANAQAASQAEAAKPNQSPGLSRSNVNTPGGLGHV